MNACIHKRELESRLMRISEFRRGHCVAAVATVISLCWARAEAAEMAVCQTALQQTPETVIVFEPPSQFTICRGGQEESDVVTGRPLFVEVITDEHTLFRFTVHGLSKQPQRTGLTRLARRSHHLAQSLHELAESGETTDELSASESLGSADKRAPSRRRIIETTRLHAAITAIERESFDLGAATATLNTWSSELKNMTILPKALEQAVRDKCAGVPTAEVTKRAATLVETIGAFRAARDAARAMLLSAGAPPANDQSGEAEKSTVPVFDRVHNLADSLRGQARDLAPMAEQIAQTCGLLHEAMRGASGALPISSPVHIGKLDHSGFAVLEIDASPVVLFRSAEDWEDTDQETISQRFRFAVISPHYVDIEAGIGVVAGMPGVPATVARGSTTVLASKSTSQFVGLALVELEPLRFLYSDKPLAGILRFPVIGVPLNRNPTQNYFAGAGLGWTGIGSITAGPFITREASFAQGYAVGQTLPSGTSLATVTSPAYQVGYFAAASIDLLGLLHLFLPVHESTFDAITGADVEPYSRR